MGRTRPPRPHNAFSVFGERPFLIFAVAHFLAIASLWGSRITIDWMVLELTGSAVQVGAVTALQFLPMLVLGFLGGVVSDRIPKRAILLLTNVIIAVSLFLVGGIEIFGEVSLVLLYALSLVIGLLTIIDNPARQVIVGELVLPSRLGAAVQMNASIFQLGAVFGPAIIGAILSLFGGGPALVAAGLFSTITVVLISQLRVNLDQDREQLPTLKPAYVFGGFVYAWKRKYLVWVILLAFVMSVFARNIPIMLTDYANRIFDSGAGGYAFMNTMVALGALIGVLSLVFVTRIRLRGILLLLVAVGLGHLAASGIGDQALFIAVVAVVGATHFVFGTASNMYIQLNTERQARGRVLSIMTSLFIGGQAIGGPIAGFLTDHFGGPFAFLVTGSVVLAFALVAGSVILRQNRGRASR